MRDRTTIKIADIDAKIHSLRRMRRALSKLVVECSGRGPVTECPILEALYTQMDSAKFLTRVKGVCGSWASEVQA